MAATAAGPLDGLKMIDCDAHITEPPDLWTSRAPAGMKDRMPYQKTIDGVTNWYMSDEYWCTTGGNVIEQTPDGARKVLGSHMLQPFERVAHAAWDVKARLEVMDTAGVYAQILYPNAIGFSSNHMMEVEDPDLRMAVTQAYNDYLADIQIESGQRLFPQGLLPIWDMPMVEKEMVRAHERGLTGFILTDRPDMVDLPDLYDPYWHPMWQLASDLKLPLNFHIGSGKKNMKIRTHPVDLVWEGFGRQRSLAVGATQLYMSNARVIVNLIMSDLFDRFPGLKIVSAESGIGWVPFILEAAEYQLDEMVTEERHTAQRRPTEYFRDHIYVTFWFEKHGPKTSIEQIGVKNVLLETDFPHPTCLFPSAKEHFEEVLGGLDPYTRRRVVQDNAVEVYHLPVPIEA